MERIHNSLYVLHHLIGGIGQSSWELSYPVYRFDCGDLTGDSCPEIAVGVIKTTRHDPTRDKRLLWMRSMRDVYKRQRVPINVRRVTAVVVYFYGYQVCSSAEE